jgi:Fe2+ or Zn2+ uptake regulation protein
MAEEVYEQLNVASRHMSPVTVYNTVKILVDYDLLLENDS